MAKRNDNPVKAFWSTREIAAHLGVCERTVRRWIETEDLISHRFGRRVRISQVDFDAFLRRHRNTG